MNAKKFTLYMVYAISGFVLFNFVVWHFYVEKILVHKDGMISGDLARMGYLPQFIHLRKNNINLSKTHVEVANYHGENIDMVTIGDSFSNGGAFGLNRYYQDYFASELNCSILNIDQHPKSKNYMETVILLANSGFLKKHNVKYILIESTVRKAIDRHISLMDYNFTLSDEEINKYYKFGNNDGKDSEALPEVSFINNGNFKYMAYRLLYNFSDRAFISDTHHVQLSKPFFSVDSGKELLFYHKDIASIQRDHIKEKLQEMNENLNTLAVFLENKHGVKLIFMPVVTKYDLYSSYIINNPYGDDRFFELFRKLPRKYIFIDTKAILLAELEKGEKDIFYCDDTHWSYKASKKIAEVFANIMKERQ